MFDTETAQLLQSAPAIPGFDPRALPRLLAGRYVDAVTARLSGKHAGEDRQDGEGEQWSLKRIADAYEIVTSTHPGGKGPPSSAFVVGMARQIAATASTDEAINDRLEPLFSRDRIDPAIIAALLFMIAESYADARYAAKAIEKAIKLERAEQPVVAAVLAAHIRDLASGNLEEILERAAERDAPKFTSPDLEMRAVDVLYETLVAGVVMLAAEILGREVPRVIPKRFDTAVAPRGCGKEVSNPPFARCHFDSGKE